MAARYRKRFNFWLDIMDDNAMTMAEEIQKLKSQRQFTSTIRDGIRLIVDLRAGRVDVLKELFPDIIAKLTSKADRPTMPDSGDLKQDIDQIKQLILSQNAPSNGLINAPIGAPKAINTPTFRTPTFDDLGSDDLIIKKDTSTDAGKNFLQSMMALQA